MSIIVDQPHGLFDRFLCNTKLGRFIYRYICWMTLGRKTIEEFKKDAESDWVRCNQRLRDTVTQITTVQGLILAVCATFLTTTPPLQAIDYTRTRSYIWFFSSFVISVWGLICQLLFFRANLLLTVDGLTTRKLSHYACVSYFLLYGMTYAGFFLSLLCLESGFLAAILGGPLDFLSFFGGLTGVLFTILFAIFIMDDTPGANVILIMVAAGAVFWTHISTGLLCALQIYIRYM